MSKDIWHTKDEIPRQESRVVWKSGNVVCGGRFDTYYKCFCGPASQFVDLRKVSRWCYIDDLLALEIELERTRKVLRDTIKLAEEMLESIEDEGMCSSYYEDRLNEIKSITKGGNK